MNPHIKAIAISGLPRNEQTMASINHNIEAFLPKPFSSSRLLTTVKEALQRKSQTF
jgi:DNA-binding NtrC family response regulator